MTTKGFSRERPGIRMMGIRGDDMQYDTCLAELLMLATLRWASRAACNELADPGHDEWGDRVMRDINAIDGELRLVTALRRAAAHHREPVPATERIDELLDERLLCNGTGNRDADVDVAQSVPAGDRA